MMEKLKLLKSKENFYLLILVALILFLIFLWFKDGKLISSGEDGPFLLNPSKSLEVFDNIWIDAGTGFSTTDFLPRLPFIYFVNFLYLFKLEPYLIQAIVFFILMVTGCVSIFKFVKLVLTDQKAQLQVAFFSAILYLFNPFSLTQIWNRQLYSQYFLFALFPLLLYIFSRGLKERKLKFIFYFGLFSLIFSSTFGLITNVLVIWSVILIYAVYFSVSSGKKSYVIKFSILLLFFWIGTNIWWIIPFLVNLMGESIISNKNNSYENILTLRSLSEYSRIEFLIRLLQGFLFFKDTNLNTFYSSWYINLFSFTPFLIIFFNLKNFMVEKKTHFFIILSILGLVISLGSNKPFGFLIEYMFNQISFLQAFRNPYEKYGIVYMLGYIFLLSYSLALFINSKKRKIVLTVFFISWFYYLTPLVYGERINSTKIEIPNTITLGSNLLNEFNLKNYRLISVPLLTGEGVSTNWNYSGVEPSLYLYNIPTVSYSINTPIQKEFIDNLHQKVTLNQNLVNITSLLNSKYLYIREDLIDKKEYSEENLNQIKELISNEKKEILCSRTSVSGNIISNKTVFSCHTKKFQFEDSFIFEITTPKLQSSIEINFIDSKGNRNIWAKPIQIEEDGESLKYNIYPDLASEINPEFNYNELIYINLVFDKDINKNQVSESQFKIYQTPLRVKKPIDYFEKVNSNSKDQIYRSIYFNEPNQIGYISKIMSISNPSKLYTLPPLSEPLKEISIISDYEDLNTYKVQYNQVPNAGVKITPSKYWVGNYLSNSGYQNIQLLNTYNSNWKIIEDVSKEELDSNFINSFNLLSKVLTNKGEQVHVISNGYANFWQINNSKEHKGYAIIFLPQLYKDFFIYISAIFFVIFLTTLLIIKFFKKYNPL